MSTRVWHRMVSVVLSLGFASLPAKAQMVGPLANTTVGNARLIVPDGSSLRQSISSGETRWFVFGAEPGKTYVVEAVDPDSDLASNTIGALHVYAANGTTTPPAETNVDCTASTRAPAMELPVAVSGMRCVVRAFPPSPGNTQNKRGLYVAVGLVDGPSFDLRVRESTIYGRWTTNGYDFHVELENTTADAMCAEVIFLPNAGESYAGTWSGGLTTLQLTIPPFGANKTVFANGTLVHADNKGTLRIGACASPTNFVPTALHVSTYAYNPLTDKFLYFFTNAANNGATANSWSAASGAGTVTSIGTGAGLTGGPITTTGTINLAATNRLPTVACATNQIPKWNGSAWACATDNTGPVNAFVQGGNAFGTTAVLGTTDTQPLELHVANARVLRIEPPGDLSNPSPNIVGGSPANSVAAGASGATIAGGGRSGSTCGPSGASPCANTVANNFGSVGGGYGNTAGPAGTVAGGFDNTAGPVGTVAGGLGNTAGSGGTVAGGYSNTASGDTSFAVGHNVLADEPQCAVMGFFATGGANCKGVGNIIRVMGDHGFSVDWGPATGNGGGAFWVEINDLTPGRPINTYTNAYLSAGGAWTNNSDRNKKEHFAAVDPQRVLAELVALPITQWNYKVEPAVLRMGPVAQDFYAAFGLGQDDLTIAQTDEAGVAFAAIQGLNAKVDEQASMIGEQQREIADLRERISATEGLRAELAALRAELANLRDARTQIAARTPAAADGLRAGVTR